MKYRNPKGCEADGVSAAGKFHLNICICETNIKTMIYPDPQYLESIQKGDTVMYGNKPYRVQDDGKGFLHIVVFDGRRRKVAIKNIDTWFEYGTETDWIFNGWYRIFPDYNLFHQFARTEIAWLKQTA